MPPSSFFGPDPHQTPRLVLDPSKIVAQVNEFNAAFGGVTVCFPVKCCPVPVALQTLYFMGCRFEYASLGEVREVRRLDLHRRPGIFGAPARSPSDSAAARSLGVDTFVIDSADEATNLAAIDTGSSVLVRLEVESSDTTMPLSTKFGVTAAGNRELARVCADLGLNIRGYVFHVGSQTRSAKPWARAVEATASAIEAAATAGHEIDTLDIGGGFPVPYRGSPVATISEIADTVHGALESTGLTDIRLLAEPGRFLVAEAGEIHTTVLSTTRDGNHARAVLDVGVFNGLYEVLEGIDYDFRVDLRESSRRSARLWQIAGPSCDGNDVLATERAMPEGLSHGDLVVVPDAGAYADSYASDFCGLDVPQVMISASGDPEPVRDGVVRLNSSSPLFTTAKRLELELFTKAGLLDEDGSLRSYEKYDPHSVINVAFVDSEPAGVLREIWPSAEGLKTINDVDTWPTTAELLRLIGAAHVADIGTLAVAPKHQGGLVALDLYKKAWRATHAHGFTHWVAAIDVAVLDYMRTALGFDFVDLGPSVDYVGSMSTPVVGDLSHFAETGFARNPEHWLRLSEGLALDPINDFIGPSSWMRFGPLADEAVIDVREEPKPARPLRSGASVS